LEGGRLVDRCGGGLCRVLAWGYWLARRLTGTTSMAVQSAQLLAEGDLMTRLRPTGDPGVDGLIGLYNRMVDALRDERRRIEEQHFLLSRILEVSPSGIATFDFDGRIDYANKAAERLFGLPAAYLQGRRPAEAPGSLAASLARLEPGQARVIPIEGARRVRCHMGTFMDRGFSRSFVVLEELTEALREVEKAAYEKLIRMLSHEVNNTVAASTSLLSSCLNYAPQIGGEDRDDFETALKVVIERSTQLNVFMRGFAEVVRLPPPRREECDLAHVARGVGRLAHPLGADKWVEWRWEIPEGVAPVRVDRSQLEQVLLNVLKNAIEAVPANGVVTVSVGQDGATPWLAVQDNGPGVPDVVREHLFTPFFSTKPGGQGIGLTLVQEILRQHDLPFALDSAPGGPTRFVIRFPPLPRPTPELA
ncbi:MAG: PAS domain-containing protein, partial [Acidobacteria bacterium]